MEHMHNSPPTVAGRQAPSNADSLGVPSIAPALKDPVRGMAVTEQSPNVHEHEGRKYFFCGPRCRARFADHPAQFLATSSASAAIPPAPAGTIFTCPMHPEVRQDHPDNCPKCGMTLEPEMPSLNDEGNPEPGDFQRRFWWTLPLTGVVFVLAMFGHRLQWMSMASQSWVELAIAAPIVLWAGFPFFHPGWCPVSAHGLAALSADCCSGHELQFRIGNR